MRIIAWALYALAGLGGWSGLVMGIRRDWWQVGAFLIVAALCWFAAGVLLEVWA